MAKNTKKIKVLQQRIEQIEAEMAAALQKKGKGVAYDVPKALKLIEQLKQDIKKLQ